MPISTVGTGPDRASLRVGWLRSRTGLIILVGMLLALGTLVLGYANKARCTGPEFDSDGRSAPYWPLQADEDVCYSDIQMLWIGREVNDHVFPYVDGSYDPVNKQILGGSLEYPVLTGVFIWLTALPAHNDAQFLASSAWALGVAGLIVAFLLLYLAGIRAGWWILTPPIVAYAFHNWDLLVVAAVLGAFTLVLRAPGARRPVRRLVWAAVLLGIGGGLKLYPLMFALPLALWVGLGVRRGPVTLSPSWGLVGRLINRAVGEPAHRSAKPARSVLGADTGPERGARSRWLLALMVAIIPFTVFVAVNVPFMIISFRGWWASFQFQWSRPIEESTNSIWFWGARPDNNADNLDLQSKLGELSTICTALGLLLAVGLGFWRYLKEGRYPWLPVCAAMLAAYLLLNKVHSPQYVLWLLPFMVLLRIRAGWIIAYLIADLAVDIGFFKWQVLLLTYQPSGVYDSLSAQAVMIGVWGRAALLVGLFFAFLAAPVAVRQTSSRLRLTRRPAAADRAPGSSHVRRGRPGTRTAVPAVPAEPQSAPAGAALVPPGEVAR